MKKGRIKQQLDFELVKELNITMENEYDVYKQEEYLGENYFKKWKKGKFNFEKAQLGVKNLIVTPYVRKYQKEWGVNVGNKEREAISKARLRRIMDALREKDKGGVFKW